MDWITDIWHWFQAHAGLTTGLFVASVVLLVVSLWIGHYYLTTIPADYFQRRHVPLANWRHSRPILWWSLIVGKNVLGALFALAGIIMFFTPGQGILTLLMGLALMDFPGKQRIERAIVRRPAVRTLIDGLRSRAGKPPLEFADSHDAGESAS